MSAPGDGLERLLSAVFEGDEPTPELLARYARDPGSLSAEARREIERAIETYPELAEEVRTLRSFRMPDLAERPVRRRAPGRLRRVSVWATAAAAAVLVFALTPSARRWLEAPGGRVEVPAPSEAPAPAPDATAALPPEPPAPETPSAPPSEPEGQPADAPEPLSPPDPVAEAPRAPQPPDPAPQVAIQEPTPAPAPAPGESPAPSPVPVPGPIAMLEPAYRRPSEALDRRRMVVAMRGPDAGSPVLAALAPEHVAFTADFAPALFWSLSGSLPEGSKLLFRILEERSGEALVERELAAPASPGLQRIRLAEQGATLAPGVVYTWFVVLRADPENPARDELAQGWIERRETDVTGAEPGALPAQLAQAGLWYDALAAALELRAREPGNDSVARGVRALLAQGGVPVELDR